MAQKSSRPAKPQGMPQIVSHLTVHDIEAALHFYEEAFGFRPRREGCVKGPDGKLAHGELQFGDGVIMVGSEAACQGQCKTPASSGVSSPMSLYVYCDDVDAMAEQAFRAGAQVVQKPTDMFWGDRICTIVDADGYRWMFATNVADFDPAKAEAAMAGACA